MPSVIKNDDRADVWRGSDSNAP